MRVTNSQLTDSLVNHMSRLTQRQTRLQTEASTGKKVQEISDDPAIARHLLDLRAESENVAQYRKNIGRLQDTTTLQVSTLRTVQKASNRAGEIATRAVSLTSAEQRNALAAEVDQLLQQSVNELNRKDGDGYLYGGTKNGQPPFTLETDAAGVITGVTYGGNESVNETEIAAGVTFSATTPGANGTGSGPRGLVADSRSGADFFKHLIELRDRLKAGDSKAISENSQPDLQADEDNFLFHLGEIGATQARLETADSSAAERGTQIKAETSHAGDADLAETLVRLNETQTAYQATLQSASRVMNMSLMDYLR